MGRKYKNPPVIEAVCEFRLTPDSHWDLTVPGLFYERIKPDFPHREQRLVQEVELIQGLQGIQQQWRATERVLLFNQDKTMLIQLGAHLLVINALKPYPTWQEFKPRIEKAWEILQKVVEVKSLERIGLRYINRVELSTQYKLEDYFEFYPFIGKRLPQRIASFVIVAEFPYNEGRDGCRLQLVPAIAAERKNAVVLDIDYFLARPRGIEVPAAMTWVEHAHSRVEEVFEGCITDRLRAIFEEAL
jgi:uncharacterized protein (TIGR04255 family)